MEVLGDGASELPIVTAGDELTELARFFDFSRPSLSARDVIQFLLGAPATAG